MNNIHNLIKPIFAFALLLGLTFNAFASESDSQVLTNAEQALEQNSLHQKVLDFIDTSIYGQVPVKGYHKKIHQNGNSCELCHGSKEPVTPADTANCANCHGTPEDVSQLTEEMEPNPHNSPHWEAELPCDSCHIEHGESKSACSNCHQFDFQTP
jgi:DnaJ-class molecular chaperone